MEIHTFLLLVIISPAGWKHCQSLIRRLPLLHQKLVDEIFLRFSIPEQLHSDQGAQFETQLMSEVCKLLHIHKTMTTPYHPQCDGLMERFNRTLLNMLATCASDHPFDWEQYIRKVCMAYNRQPLAIHLFI